MDGVSGTVSSAQSHISITITPRIVVSQAKAEGKGVEVVKQVVLKNGVEVIIYVPSAK